MSVRFRPDRDVWEVELWVDGKRLPRKAFKTEAEARRYAEGSDVSIGNLFPKWAHELWGQTRNARMGRINTDLLVTAFGPQTRVGDIDEDKIALLIEAEFDKGNRPGTVNRKLSALRPLLRKAKKLKLIPVVPEIDSVSDPDNQRTYVLSDEEEGPLRDSLPEDADRPYRSFYDFLLYTGCRPSEATNLDWRQIDFRDEAVSFLKTKTNKARTIPLLEPAAKALKATKALGWIRPFARLDYEQFYRAYGRRRDKLGISTELVVYSLRHTCATRLGKGGMDPLRLQLWLGHSNIAMTARYCHHNVESLRGANAILTPNRA